MHLFADGVPLTTDCMHIDTAVLSTPVHSSMTPMVLESRSGLVSVVLLIKSLPLNTVHRFDQKASIMPMAGGPRAVDFSYRGLC